MKPVPKKIMDELRAAQDKYIANDPNWDGPRSLSKQSLSDMVEFWDCEINELTPEDLKLPVYCGAFAGAAGTALGSWLWYGISGLKAIPLALAGAALTATIMYYGVKSDNNQINLRQNLRTPAGQEFANVQSIAEKYAPELTGE